MHCGAARKDHAAAAFPARRTDHASSAGPTDESGPADPADESGPADPACPANKSGHGDGLGPFGSSVKADRSRVHEAGGAFVGTAASSSSFDYTRS